MEKASGLLHAAHERCCNRENLMNPDPEKPVDVALRASEEKYRSLIESIDSSIAMFDVDGCVLFANAIAARNFDLTPETMTGKSMTDLFPPESADWQLENIRKVIRTGEGHSGEAISIIGGAERWFRTSVQPVRDAFGNVTAALINATKMKASVRRNQRRFITSDE